MLIDVADGSIEAALNRRPVVSSSAGYAYWNFLAEDRGRVRRILRRIFLSSRANACVTDFRRIAAWAKPGWVGERRRIIPHVGIHIPGLRVFEVDHLLPSRVGTHPAAAGGVVAVQGIVLIGFGIVVGKFGKGPVHVEVVGVGSRPEFPIGIEQALGDVVPGVIARSADGAELVGMVEQRAAGVILGQDPS